MNGAHDLGGMHGFGPINPEPDEPVFHAEWERRMMALNLAASFLGQWNIDTSRFARERSDPAEYLSTSYYEHWLHGLELLLVEKGLITAEELETGKPEGRGTLPPVTADRIAPLLARGGPASVDVDVPPRFQPGDAVIARNLNPTTHTRIPRYVRCKRGVIERDHGVYVFPDTNAVGQGKKPQHVYNVRFTAREVWGSDANEKDQVHVDLWDDYLDPA